MLLDAWRGNPHAFFRSPFFSFDPWALERQVAPAVVTDDGQNLVVSLEIPGVPEADIQLTVTGQTLTITANRKVEVPEGYVVHQQARRGGAISRSFRLPAKIDADAARAVVRDGVLTVTLPRAAAEKARAIQVQAAQPSA